MTETAEGERARVFGEKCLFNVERGGRKRRRKMGTNGEKYTFELYS
jgi:hypothetical protein